MTIVGEAIVVWTATGLSVNTMKVAEKMEQSVLMHALLRNESWLGYIYFVRMIGKLKRIYVI
ncbi:hypothetical protein ACVCK3_03430 [Bacillus cereus]